jgi:hypothetical protein
MIGIEYFLRMIRRGRKLRGVNRGLRRKEEKEDEEER